LQSIGLDIKVLSGDSKEIDIRDEEEEEIKAHRAKAEQLPVQDPPPEPDEPDSDSDSDSFDDFEAEPSPDEIDFYNKNFARNNDVLPFDDQSLDNLPIFPDSIDDDFNHFD
jgi:hypothetical protein